LRRSFRAFLLKTAPQVRTQYRQIEAETQFLNAEAQRKSERKAKKNIVLSNEFARKALLLFLRELCASALKVLKLHPLKNQR
jgi:hypothetical protein